MLKSSEWGRGTEGQSCMATWCCCLWFSTLMANFCTFTVQLLHGIPLAGCRKIAESVGVLPMHAHAAQSGRPPSAEVQVRPWLVGAPAGEMGSTHQHVRPCCGFAGADRG